MDRSACLMLKRPETVEQEGRDHQITGQIYRQNSASVKGAIEHRSLIDIK